MEFFILKEVYTTDYPDYYYHQIEVVSKIFLNFEKKNNNFKDLKRTFGSPDKIIEEKIKKMRNVLQAYAKRNPFVGYCQGMNFVLEFLLRQNFSEEV